MVAALAMGPSAIHVPGRRPGTTWEVSAALCFPASSALTFFPPPFACSAPPLTSEFLDSIKLGCSNHFLRERALPRAFVAIANSEVRIGKICKAFDRLLDALRGFEAFEGFLWTLRSQQCQAEIALRASARIELHGFFIGCNGLIECARDQASGSFSAKRVELKRLLPERLELALLALEDLEFSFRLVGPPEPHQ